MNRNKKRIDNSGKNLTPSLKFTLKSWTKDNMFKFKKGDGVAYLILYILIPVFITIISLSELSGDNIAIAYCYMTILISAVNGIYDGANRWDSSKKSVRNLKIFIILLANAVVSIYCLWIVFYILINRNVNCRFDWILLTYFVSIIVSLFDTISCFACDIALQNCVK